MDLLEEGIGVGDVGRGITRKGEECLSTGQAPQVESDPVDRRSGDGTEEGLGILGVRGCRSADDPHGFVDGLDRPQRGIAANDALGHIDSEAAGLEHGPAGPLMVAVAEHRPV